MEFAVNKDVDALIHTYGDSIVKEDSTIAAIIKNHVESLKGIPCRLYNPREELNIYNSLKYFMFNQHRLLIDIIELYTEKIRSSENQYERFKLFKQYKEEMAKIYGTKPEWYDDIDENLPYLTSPSDAIPMLAIVSRMTYRMRAYMSVDDM